MRRRLLLGLVPALPLSLVFAACGREPVQLGLTMLAPQGLLEQATAVKLSVFDAAEGKCDDTTGHVAAIPKAAQSFSLDSKGCAAGVAWCKTITLDKDGSKKMFAIVASNESGTLAEGCTTAVIDQDPLDVQIQAHRYTPPACCNNGVLEPGEQCDTGVVGHPSCSGGTPDKCTGMPEDAVCFCDCTAKEILLSIDDSGAPNLKNGPANTKSSLALSFGPGGAQSPKLLRAAFVNSDSSAAGGSDIHERFLGPDLFPLEDPLALQLRLPLTCADTTGAGIPGKQSSPRIATTTSDVVAIVYASDEIKSGTSDVYLTAPPAAGCADTKACTTDSDCATRCNGTTCDPAVRVTLDSADSASDPAVGSGYVGRALVTWTRGAGVFGRIWSPEGHLVPASLELTIATSGSHARVAGNDDHWFVVYQGAGEGDGDGIFMKRVGAAVEPTEILVNAATKGVQDQPDIAMLADGTALVTWRSDGDIYFQRFDTNGVPFEGDQAQPLNTSGLKGKADESLQQNPVVAGAGGFFTVAWETADNSNIAARFVVATKSATSLFGYNSVTGQNDEFIATDLVLDKDKRKLKNPAVAMDTFVAIGWEDQSTGHPGVFVRRFPLPTQ